MEQSPFEVPDPSMGTAGAPELAQQWSQALSDPATRGSLIQFGLQLMQPRPAGQTVAGQVGTALGAAGEAQARSQAADIAQQNADTKTEMNDIRAENNQMRNETRLSQIAGNADIATRKLGLAELALNQRKEKDTAQLEINANKLELARDRAKTAQEKNDISLKIAEIRKQIAESGFASREEIARQNREQQAIRDADQAEYRARIATTQEERARHQAEANRIREENNLRTDTTRRDISAETNETRRATTDTRVQGAQTVEQMRQEGAAARAGTGDVAKTARERTRQYETYRTKIETENARARALGLTTTPVPSYRDWVATGGVETPPARTQATPAAPAPSAPAPAPAPGSASPTPAQPPAQAPLTDPAALRSLERVPGVTTITTSRGQFRWNGSGWDPI